MFCEAEVAAKGFSTRSGVESVRSRNTVIRTGVRRAYKSSNAPYPSAEHHLWIAIHFSIALVCYFQRSSHSGKQQQPPMQRQCCAAWTTLYYFKPFYVLVCSSCVRSD
jgi:hypothetical protein